MSDRLESEKIAARYSKALFDIATPEERQAILQGLNLLQSVLEQTPEFMSFLSNPATTLTDKHSFLHQYLSHKDLSPRIISLMTLLLENNRIHIFPQISSSFHQWVNQANNRIEAEVISATEMNAPLKERLSKTLASLFGFQHVELKSHIDTSLLGGLTIKIQDQVIDGSYLGRLEAIRKHIHQF
jgi:F-type H+-transporting ATPase subunit delta